MLEMLASNACTHSNKRSLMWCDQAEISKALEQAFSSTSMNLWSPIFRFPLAIRIFNLLSQPTRGCGPQALEASWSFLALPTGIVNINWPICQIINRIVSQLKWLNEQINERTDE